MKSVLIVVTGLALVFGLGNERRVAGTTRSIDFDTTHVLNQDAGKSPAIWAAVAGGKVWSDMFM